jgi:hypothetical protein
MPLIFFRKYYTTVLLWIFLTSTAPFIFFRWPGHPYKILTFLSLLLMCIHLSMKKILIIDKKLLFIISLQIIYYILLSIFYRDISNINLSVQLISLYIAIVYILNYVGVQKFVISFILVITYMGFGGLCAFFYHLFIGIEPFFRVEYGNDVSYFLGTTTTNVFISIGDLRIIRYSGFFDEPGTYGLFAIFALILNRVYLGSIKYDFFIIIFGLFTFSLAFYFAVFLYFIFFYFSIKSLKFVFITFILLILTYLFVRLNDNESYLKLYEMSFGRIEDTQNGLSTSNRGALMNLDLSSFLSNPIFGVGPKNIVAGANIFAIPAKYGIVGMFFFYIFLLWLFILLIKKNKNLSYFKLFMILLLSLFHRPELSSVFTLIFLYFFIYSLRKNTNFINKNYTL